METNISVLVTSRCTLNCEYCSSGIPYHTNHRDFPAAEVVSQVQKVLELYAAAKIDIKHLDLLGGEPLLCPELTNIIDGIWEYHSVFHELRILTNGTLLPSTGLLEVIRGRAIPFLMIISDYGVLSPKSDEICKLLEEYGLNYRIDRYHDTDQYFGGWVSYGQDGIVTGTTEERYYNCAFHNSGAVEVFSEYLHPCVRTLALHSTGRAEIPAEDYIDLRDEFEENVEKLSSFMAREEPYAACKHCSGLGVNAIRYPAARQAIKCNCSKRH